MFKKKDLQFVQKVNTQKTDNVPGDVIEFEKGQTLASERKKTLIMRTMLLIPLILMGAGSYYMSGYNSTVLYSWPIVIILLICLNINEYYGNSYPHISEKRKKLLTLHWSLGVGILISGLICAVSTIMAVSKK